MSWRVSLGFALTVASSALLQSSGQARADEAYLCGPDTVVYVAVADLEAKKHTDPCIAAYYGLKVEASAVANAAAKPAAAVDKVAKKAAPIAAPSLKALGEPDIPDRVPRKLQRQASLEPPRTAPGTDYRNVRVINAASEDAAWFHHVK